MLHDHVFSLRISDLLLSNDLNLERSPLFIFCQQRMDQYFAQMVKIAEERKSRIKFTLKDAIELRQVCFIIKE